MSLLHNLNSNACTAAPPSRRWARGAPAYDLTADACISESYK